MSLRAPERIHLVPIGFEEDRVYKPALDLDASKVVLINHENATGKLKEKQERHQSTVEEKLRDNNIDIESVMCDFFDMHDALGVIAQLAKNNEDENIFVNISSGSKITAIAGMIACMVTGATPYYVIAERYEEIPRGVEDVVELPKYPVQAPEPEQVRILSFIDSQEEAVTKKQLIEFSEENNLPFMANRNIKSDKGKYPVLDSNIISPLREHGYIEERKIGREKKVTLTENGKKTLQAFGYMIPNNS